MEIKLKKANIKYYDSLLKIVKNPIVMSTVGTGKVWSEEYLRNHLILSETEWNNPKNSYVWIILDDENVIGYLRWQKKDYFKLRIFIDTNYQNKGVGTTSLKISLNKLEKYVNDKYIFAEVHYKNIKSEKMLIKSGFKFNKISTVGNTKVKVFRYEFFKEDSNKIFKIESKYKDFQNNFERFLSNKGMIKHTNQKNIDFYYVDSEYKYKRNLNKIFHNYNVDIITVIRKDTKQNIKNKGLLYKSFEEKYPDKFKKYFPKQYQLDNIKNASKYKYLFDGSLWILKPVYGFAGENVKVTDNYDEYLKHIKNSDVWVISEYIVNPLLTKSGKKFHLRILFILSIFNNSVNGYYMKKIPIFTAKDKFTLESFDDSIHNTHFTYSEKDLYMDNYFAKTYGEDKELYVFQQITKLFYYVMQMVKNQVKCYTKNCLETFGADIIITDDFRIKCIEINEKPGFDAFKLDIKENGDRFVNIYYDIISNNKNNNLYYINNIIEN